MTTVVVVSPHTSLPVSGGQSATTFDTRVPNVGAASGSVVTIQAAVTSGGGSSGGNPAIFATYYSPGNCP